MRQPFDIDAICTECGMTVATLSENTGIPVDEIRGFFEGRTDTLSARDYMGILLTLNDNVKDGALREALPPSLEPLWRSIQNDPQRSEKLRNALRLLQIDVAVEEEMDDRRNEEQKGAHHHDWN